MTDEYLGKFYPWSPQSEQRALELEAEGLSRLEIAKKINSEFPKHIICTREAVIGKMWRLKKTKCRSAKVATRV
jgi:hypothetical protein